MSDGPWIEPVPDVDGSEVGDPVYLPNGDSAPVEEATDGDT